MKKITFHWFAALAMTAIGFSIGHFIEVQYLKSKYPAVYKFENTKNPELDRVYDATTGKFSVQVKDENYDPEAHKRYSEEQNSLTFGIMLSSAIIAVGSLWSVSKQKENGA